MYEIAVGLLLEVVLPAALASLVLLGAAGFFCNAKWREALLPLALAAGFLAGNYYRGSLAYLPESFGWEWLLAAVIVTLAVSFACHWLPWPVARFGIPIVVAAALATCFVSASDKEPRSVMQMAGLAIVVLANATVLCVTSQRHDKPLAPFAYLLCLLGGTTMIAVYGSVRLADGTTMLAAALLGLGILAVCWSLPITSLTSATALLVTGTMFVVHGDNYSEVKTISFLLMALAPLPLAIALIPALQVKSRGVQIMIETILLALAPSAAIALAIYYAGLPLPV